MTDKGFPSGLSQAEVLAIQKAEGFNELASGEGRSLLKIAAEVAREPMFLLLIGAGSIYLLMGDVHEALVLLGFVFVIMTVTILQERRTEKALDALRDLSSPRALVLRDGNAVRIPGREVVRDDILILSEGDRVPADGLLLAAHELTIDESLLTGESVPVQKISINGGETQETNCVFAGTLVVSGQGTVRVTAIGSATELGRIGKSLQAIENESSPLQREMAVLTKTLAAIGIALCLVVTVLYVWSRGGWLDGLLAGITLAMSLLPQEFPVMLIIFLALGARRIAQKQVLTRRLSAIETLGETTALCVDKTGTITMNRMAVASLAVDDALLDIGDQYKLKKLPQQFRELVEYCVLASETDPHDPMEKAFHRLAQDCLPGSEHFHPDWELVREYELSADLFAMSHLWRVSQLDRCVVAAKGAPEAMAELCRLSPEQTARLTAQAVAMADRGLRVLGVAKATYHGETWPERQQDFEFEFLGLAGLADPLRPEVPAAVQECKQAGIRVVMISGDHPRTARAIAAQAGIDVSRILTGSELARLEADSLAEAVRGVSVFARVTPQQKLNIVEALKANGEIVAMTGDGVNDAPALKSAHIGIAMGQRGTDVAREAASLVLLNDDFTAIVHAIRLGRRIFWNLRQAMIFVLAVHIPIIGLSFLPLLFGLPLVLAPIHIAFFELVVDPACSLVFEAEEGDGEVMNRPPRSPGEPLVSINHIFLSVIQGALITLVVASLYWLSLSSGIDASEARGIAFVALIAANSMLIFSSRSTVAGLKRALGCIPTVSYWVLAGTLAGLVAVTCIPMLAEPFRFLPTTWERWLGAFGIGIATMLLLEAAKLLGSYLRVVASKS